MKSYGLEKWKKVQAKRWKTTSGSYDKNSNEINGLEMWKKVQAKRWKTV